jgi:hypothetical protein
MTRSTTAAVARPPGAPSVDCLKDLSRISILNKSCQISHHASFWPMGSCTKFMRWWRLLIHFLKVFWSTPCLLPTIDECTDRWSPRTMMPHHEVVTVTRVPSMVGACALTRLHQWLGLRHKPWGKGGGRRWRRTTTDIVMVELLCLYYDKCWSCNWNILISFKFTIEFTISGHFWNLAKWV